MKQIILCPKEFGNTFTVCEYLHNNSDADLMVINNPEKRDFSSYDSIILASGVYANHVHKNIVSFLKDIPADSINKSSKIYLFLTWIGRGSSDKSAFNEVKRLLCEKGINIEENYIECYGNVKRIIKKSHPNEEDCKKVLSWMEGLK